MNDGDKLGKLKWNVSVIWYDNQQHFSHVCQYRFNTIQVIWGTVIFVSKRNTSPSVLFQQARSSRYINQSFGWDTINTEIFITRRDRWIRTASGRTKVQILRTFCPIEELLNKFLTLPLVQVAGCGLIRWRSEY